MSTANNQKVRCNRAAHGSHFATPFPLAPAARAAAGRRGGPSPWGALPAPLTACLHLPACIGGQRAPFKVVQAPWAHCADVGALVRLRAGHGLPRHST